MNGNVEPNQELVEAIGRLYDVFQRYPLEPGFDERCFALGEGKAIARRLEEVPLRGAPLKDVAIYAFKATLTMGNLTDFKHFLPRLLELSAWNAEWYFYTTNVYEKLHNFGWETWQEDERETIKTFVGALWSSMLAVYPWLAGVEEVLEPLCAANFDLTGLLTEWEQRKNVEAVLHLADVVAICARRREAGGAQSLKKWLFRDETRARLEEASALCDDKETSACFCEAVAMLSKQAGVVRGG